MKHTFIAVGLVTLMAVSPVFAAKKVAVKHHRNVSVGTLAKRQSHLASEIATTASQMSDRATSKPNKKLNQQAAFMHKAASDSHLAAQDLLQAAKYSRR